MHDPMTVAHDIKYPWRKYIPWPKKYRHSSDKNFEWRRMQRELSPDAMSRMDPFWNEGWRNTFITIWHVDPGPGDDACGYSRVRLTKEQRERLHNAAWHEGYNPHFLRCAASQWNGTVAEAECLYRGLVLFVMRVLRIKEDFIEASQIAVENTHFRDVSKAGDTFCFLPGYHTNSTKDSRGDRERHFEGILCGVASTILTRRRPWWKHPRWHFWHWKFQCHPLNNFKRWAFSRCCKCGGRFTWGYSPVTNSWHGTGPLWFRSEKNTYHSDCNSPKDPCVKENVDVVIGNPPFKSN